MRIKWRRIGIVAWELFGIANLVIGFAGMPDDAKTWRRWLQVDVPYSPYVAIFVFGIAVVGSGFVFDFTTWLKSRQKPLQLNPQPELETEPKKAGERSSEEQLRHVVELCRRLAMSARRIRRSVFTGTLKNDELPTYTEDFALKAENGLHRCLGAPAVDKFWLAVDGVGTDGKIEHHTTFLESAANHLDELGDKLQIRDLPLF